MLKVTAAHAAAELSPAKPYARNGPASAAPSAAKTIAGADPAAPRRDGHGEHIVDGNPPDQFSARGYAYVAKKYSVVAETERVDRLGTTVSGVGQRLRIRSGNGRQLALHVSSQSRDVQVEHRQRVVVCRDETARRDAWREADRASGPSASNG
jgi:hypothetical protein